MKIKQIIQGLYETEEMLLPHLIKSVLDKGVSVYAQVEISTVDEFEKHTVKLKSIHLGPSINIFFDDPVTGKELYFKLIPADDNDLVLLKQPDGSFMLRYRNRRKRIIV